MKALSCVQNGLLIIIWLLAETPSAAQQDKQPLGGTVPYEPYNQISHDVSPAWSPDDKQIIFTRVVPPTHGSLYLVSASGGTATPFSIENKYAEGQPAWSPDGARVAFVSNRSGQMHIWTANTSGGDPKRITFSPTYDVEPCWSPDGKQIAYSSYPGSNIMVVPATGGQAERIAKGFSPSWSPDGKRIAYFSTESSPQTVSIFVKPVDGGEAKHLACSTTAEGMFWRPTMDWSPEGNRLVAMRLVNGTWELAIINTDSDHVEGIVPVKGSALFPRWSHDGRGIVFSSMDTSHPSVLRVVTPRGELKTEFGEHQQYIPAQFVRYRSGDGLEIPSYLFLPRPLAADKHPAVPAAPWLPDLAEAVAGRRLRDDGTPEIVPAERWQSLNVSLGSLPGHDFYARWSHWFLGERLKEKPEPFVP